MYDLGFIAYVFSGTFDHIRQTCSNIYVCTYMYVHAYIVFGASDFGGPGGAERNDRMPKLN